MTSFLVRLLPDRLFLIWLGVAVAVCFAFSIGGAAGLGFEASAIENGPQENIEIALLIIAALVFMATAIVGKGPGAPVLAGLSLIFGLMGLREFETPIDNDLLFYLAGHASRIHWAILCLVMIVFLSWRGRRWGPRAHFASIRAVWVPLGTAAGIVLLGSVAERIAGEAIPGSHLHDIMEWLEETLEVCAYVVAATTAVWMARIRRTPPA